MGSDVIINRLDFSSLSENEKKKAAMFLYDEKNYEFSLETVNGKLAVYITELQTNEKYDFIDYVKNN